MMNKKLYSLIRNIELPSAIHLERSYDKSLESTIFPGYISMVWPDGSPCVLIEMYLLDRSKAVKVNTFDGGTLKGDAADLSHLVRFCYLIKREFWELNHCDIDLFSEHLVNERDDLNQYKRDNNTVNSIISTSILFLKWLQDNICLDRYIVGIDDKNHRYQIKLKHSADTHSNKNNFNNGVFQNKLPKAITQSKEPISSNGIKLLWDAINKIRIEAVCSNNFKSKFSKKQQIEHLDYMQKRREIQLILLQYTGLRPQEMVTIEVLKNINELENCRIILPTAKTSKGTQITKNREEERIIPIDRTIAIKIQVFIQTHRDKLIKRLINSGLITRKYHIDDYLFLNPQTGLGIQPASARQDFRRITVIAGLTEKTCQSMFRHRFITNMVKYHLSAFTDKNPVKSRHFITESDYRTILRKVSAFTGHKNPDSLYAYIDIAWNELNAFSDAYDVKKLNDKLNSIQHSLNSLKTNIAKEQGISNKSTLLQLNERIDEIASMTMSGNPYN